MDKTTGRLSSKEEVTYKSTLKVDDDDNDIDAVQGFLSEVQTQVKFNKVPTSTKINSFTKATNKHIMFHFLAYFFPYFPLPNTCLICWIIVVLDDLKTYPLFFSFLPFEFQIKLFSLYIFMFKDVVTESFIII